MKSEKQRVLRKAKKKKYNKLSKEYGYKSNILGFRHIKIK